MSNSVSINRMVNLQNFQLITVVSIIKIFCFVMVFPSLCYKRYQRCDNYGYSKILNYSNLMSCYEPSVAYILPFLYLA